MTSDEHEDEKWADRLAEAREEYADRRKPLFRCSDRMCGGLDCANCYGPEAAAAFVLKEKQDDCLHTDHECGVCIECGKDISDDIAARAELRADEAQDR